MLKKIFRRFAVNTFVPQTPEQKERVESNYMEKDLETFLDRFLSEKNGKNFIMVRHG